MVPIRLDFFTAIIFLGTVQGLFLTTFFFRKGRQSGASNVLLGLLIFSFSAFSLDIFLGYSGYMTRVLHLVDSTEPLNFVIGPLAYLYTVYTLKPGLKFKKKDLWHFLPALLYAIYGLFFYLQTADYKYNAYIDAYYPELPRIDAPGQWHQDPLLIKANIDELQYTFTTIYVVLTIRFYRGWQQQKLESEQLDRIGKWVKGMLAGLITGMVAIFFIKLIFERDLGEYLIASVIMLMIYSLAFYVISNSSFFNQQQEAQPAKYEKSAFPEDRLEGALRQLNTIMETEKPFLSPQFSLPALAEKTKLTTHQLSQLLNAHLKQNFYEFTAAYRIEEAKIILSDKGNTHLSIEQIAENVGYYSKSSFNTAFKKITGLTPSQFRKQALKDDVNLDK